MFTWLFSLASAIPLYFTYKVLTGLGLAIISVTGWTVVVNSAFTALASHMSGASADIVTLLNIMGLPSGLGIISGAIISGFTLKTLTSFTLGAAT